MIILLTLALFCSRANAPGHDENLRAFHFATFHDMCRTELDTMRRNEQSPTITTSHNKATAATSRNQAMAAPTCHNKHTAASQSHTSTTFESSHRPAMVLHSNAATNGTTSHRDRAETSSQLVHNDNANLHSDESGNESEAGDNATPPQARAKRNSRRSHRDPHPHHLGFYSGTWYDALVDAKNSYRLFIHTQNPFPDRNSNSLRDAHDCLLEVIVRYKDDGIQLDEGTVNNQLLIYTIVTNNITDVYNTHRSSMTSLVSSIHDFDITI